ncbi:MAG: hypothetical protein HQM08_19630 [Candidatus Riflebacteria bacterium]|nr:hypothetical protein [Candidatus Riflebacteria bacterium]
MACEGFIHSWQPVWATFSNNINNMLSLIYFDTLKSKLDQCSSGTWEINVSEDEKNATEAQEILKETIASIASETGFTWKNDLGLMETGKLASQSNGGVWISFVDTLAKQGVSFDGATPPYYFLRVFSEGKCKVRTLAAMKDGKVVLIDEIPVNFVSETDFSMNFSPTFGGLLLRRVSYSRYPMEKPNEITLIPIPN